MEDAMPIPFPINHDLHNHTALSECCADEKMTAANTFAFAKEHGYEKVVITDHFWDPAAPGASDWYAPQDLDHVRKILPLPKSDTLELLFGCETEFCGGNKIGITRDCYSAFDMIVVPVNHFHMEGFVRPVDCNDEVKVAELLTARLEELCRLSLPWRKIGVAHLNAANIEGIDYNVALGLAPEARLREVFRFLGKNGAGIELNAACFLPGWREYEDAALRLFRIALEENCRFYCASDAHATTELGAVPERMREVADALGLVAANAFSPKYINND